MDAYQSVPQRQRVFDARSTSSETSWIWTVLYLFLGAVAIAALVVGAIALANYNKKPWEKDHPHPSSSPAPSSGPGDCDSYVTKACSDVVDTDTVLANNVSTDVLSANDADIETLAATNITADMISATTIKTESICNDVLEHTQSAVLPPSHRFQTLQGAGVESVVPAPVFPAVEFPLDNLTLGYFNDGDSFIIPGTPLRMTVVGTSLSLIDVSGEKILQLGDPEPDFYYGYGYNDQADPGDNERVGLRLSLDTSLLPPGAITVTVDLEFETSTEYYYDFNTVSGPINLQFDGFGTVANPYVDDSESSIAIYPGLPLEDVYIKDVFVYQGLDNCRLRIQNVAPAALPPIPPLGPTGLDMTLPSDLTPYVGKDIIVCSNDNNHHTINLTSTGLSFDSAGDYTELRFVDGAGCCATLMASAPDRLAVHTSHSSCLAFCKPFGQSCATDLNKLASVNAVYELDQTGVLPPTHSTIKFGAGGIVAFLPCGADIENYVGRHFTLTSDTSQSNRVQILEEPGVECDLTFQIGDVVTGRNPAKTLLLHSERGATVQFVVVSPTLISVLVNKDVRACDAEGRCAHVGDVLNPWLGWWTADNYWQNDIGAPLQSGSVFHVELDPQGTQNRLRVTSFSGGARYVYPTSLSDATFSAGDVGTPVVLDWYQTAPDETTFGTPIEFGLQFRARLDLESPDRIYQQLSPYGTEEAFGFFPFVEVATFEWDRRATTFAPYRIFRRIGAPFGAGTRDPHGATSDYKAPELLPTSGLNHYFNGLESFRDRRFMFRWHVDQNMHTYGARFSPPEPLECTNVASWDEALDLRDRLETQAIEVVTNIVRVQKTITARGLTLVETDAFHTVNMASLVKIAGVQAPWDSINGEHRVGGFMQSRVANPPAGSIDLGATPADSSYKYIFEIDFDSSALPANATTGYFDIGQGTVTVVHGPVTAGSEYLPWADATMYWDSMILGDGIHHRPHYILNGLETDPARRCLLMHANWTEVQRDIATDPSGIHANAGPSARDPAVMEGRLGYLRRFNEDLSSRYVGQWHAAFADIPEEFNTETRECLSNAKTDFRLGGFFWAAENDPTGLSYNPLWSTIDTVEKRLDNPLAENIAHHYCADGQAFYPVWKVDGAPSNDFFGIEFTASAVYPPYDGTKGSYFVGGTVPYGQVPDDPNMSVMTRGFPLNGPCENTPGCNVTACAGNCTSNYQFIAETDPELWTAMYRHTYCCPLNTVYTDGAALGYCYFADTTQTDPQNYETARTMAPPGLGGGGNPRGRREAVSAKWAPTMQRLLVNHSVTDMILDIRGNGGGDFLPQLTLSEFFGAERNRSYANLYVKRGEGQTPTQNYDDVFDPYNFGEFLYDDGVRTQYPELNEAAYPGSVLTNGKVIIISNWRAGSGGDLFPQPFAGDANDGDLGAGVQVSVVGNPIGTLQGCSDPDGAKIPATFNSKMLAEPGTGRPISPYFMTSERVCANGALGDRVTSACHKIPLLYPTALPALPGKSGGAALPHDYETLWWPDIGHLPNLRPTLPGWPCAQTPNISDPTTWRDAWLEASILKLSGAKKRSARGKQSPKVAEWRASIASGAFSEDHRNKRSPDEHFPCGDAALVSANEVPRWTLGHSHVHGGEDPEERWVDYTVEGVTMDADALQGKFHSILRHMMKNGVACEKPDGTIGYTTKAIEHGLPKITA